MAPYGWSWRVLGAALCIILVGFGTAFGQSVSSGTIHGIVKDESGGVLPGVTATLTSPALQVRELVQVTDAEGAYRFVDLPAGTYSPEVRARRLQLADSRRSPADRRLHRAC